MAKKRDGGIRETTRCSKNKGSRQGQNDEACRHQASAWADGYYEQKPIAELMGEMAESIGPECVFAAGDVHHFWGVASVNDPLWITNFEQVYSHPELMIPWYPGLGNHECRGNTQAVLDYASVSRRWMMPARYYTKVFEDDGVSIRFVLIDTSPLIDRYRTDSDKYPDAGKQDIEAQLRWLDEQLRDAKEDWDVIIGHHPLYAETPKAENERADMHRRIADILRRHRVDIYASGHIHNFQHLRVEGTDTDFVVNSSASLARKVSPVEGTVFCSPEAGFSVIAADKHELNLHFIDSKGNCCTPCAARGRPQAPAFSAPTPKAAPNKARAQASANDVCALSIFIIRSSKRQDVLCFVCLFPFIGSRFLPNQQDNKGNGNSHIHHMPNFSSQNNFEEWLEQQSQCARRYSEYALPPLIKPVCPTAKDDESKETNKDVIAIRPREEA